MIVSWQSQNRRNPRQGIETRQPPPSRRPLPLRQNRRNPRQGIETSIPCPVAVWGEEVRIDEIPVRGLKPVPTRSRNRPTLRVRIDEIPVRGLKRETFPMNVIPKPLVRIDEIPVRGLKLGILPSPLHRRCPCQNRRNPRQGIETDDPRLFQPVIPHESE